MSAFNCINARPGEPGTRCAKWCGNKEACICVETGEASSTLDKIAFTRWMEKQTKPSLEAAFCAGRVDGYTLGRMVSEMIAPEPDSSLRQVPEGAPSEQVMTLAERIGFLEMECGSLRRAGEITGVDPAYLSRLKRGEKDAPSEETLRKLGLVRRVGYAIAPKASRQKSVRVGFSSQGEPMFANVPDNPAPPTSGTSPFTCDECGKVECCPEFHDKATPAQAGAELPEAGFDAGSGDSNVEAVRSKLLDRSRKGVAEYGVNTQRSDYNRDDWLRELQTELMDGAVYIEAALNCCTCPSGDGSLRWPCPKHSSTPTSEKRLVVDDQLDLQAVEDFKATQPSATERLPRLPESSYFHERRSNPGAFHAGSEPLFTADQMREMYRRGLRDARRGGS